MAIINGTAASETLTGGVADDTINGLDGNDSLDGGGGNDTLEGGNGNDTLNGGIGTNTASYSTATAAVNVNLTISIAQNTVGAGTDTLISIANLTGSAFNDTLFGDASANTLIGLSGADRLYAGAGNDSVVGAAGNDRLEGQDGNDTLDGGADQDQLFGGDGNDSLTGGAGNDLLDGGAGIDTLVGGTGYDVYYIDSSDVAIVEAINEGTDTVHVGFNGYVLAANLENLTLAEGVLNGDGNTANNVLRGNVGANTIGGGDGNDTLWGQEGNDSLAGGNGIDTLLGGDGTDVLDGGAGRDLLYGDAGNDTIIGGDGNDTLGGGLGNDSMQGGLGNDMYYVDSASDVVTEAANEGIDLIQSEVSFDLATALSVENVILLGTSNLSATGSADNNTLTGNDGNNLLSGLDGNDILRGGLGIDTLVGGLGNDQYFLDSTDAAVTEAAGAGTDTVYVDFDYTLTSNVEKLVLLETDLELDGTGIDGTGNDLSNTMNGNADNNDLIGLGGNDVLDGKAGNDSMRGGTGNDIYYVDSASDSVVELAAEGSDRVNSLVSYTLGDNVENLTLIGTNNLSGTGNSLNNVLRGNSGNNILDGGVGNDSAYGGLGNDTFYTGSTSDRVFEYINEGTDTLYASATINLDFNNNSIQDADEYVENLVLQGSGNINATGNGLDNQLTGTTGNNSLTGGLGNDTLIGNGGNDTLNGGSGNDTYYIDSASDSVSDSGGTTDVMYSSIVGTTTIASGIEELRLIGSATDANGDGNSNIIYGNTEANKLDGLGGADTMYGLQGNDTYVVDNAGDVVTESVSEGVDLVQSAVTYTLTSDVDNLTLTGGATNINGGGNTLDNIINGNTGNNILSGLDGDDSIFGSDGLDTLYGGNGNDTLDGGVGNDTMYGGAGDDLFIISSGTDSIGELAGEGYDTIQIAADINVSALGEFERVELGGTGNYTVTGGAENNTFIGNTGNNTLNGNAGNDSLEGGTGNDTLNGGNNDDTLNGGGGTDSMNGGTGNDTYYIDIAADSITDSGGTDTVHAAISYTLGNNFENLVLDSGALNGTGNGSANDIKGNGAANTLSGDDTGDSAIDNLYGGAGDDTYIILDTSGDVITELAGEGTDTVRITTTGVTTYTLGSNMENLTFVPGTGSQRGYGNSLNNVLRASNYEVVLFGYDGNDTLYGDTDENGADTLDGGLGNDTYYVSYHEMGNTIDDRSGSPAITNYIIDSGGIDTIIITNFDDAGTSFSVLTLPDYLENVTITGTEGHDVHATTTGVVNNTFVGNSGNNYLYGEKGNDFLQGMDGNDRLFGGDDNDYLEGNNGNDSIDGGLGNDILSDVTGTDSMYGGDGNDTYIIDQTADFISDTNGTDTVIFQVGSTAAVTVNLASDFSGVIENYTLSSQSVMTIADVTTPTPTSNYTQYLGTVTSGEEAYKAFDNDTSSSKFLNKAGAGSGVDINLGSAKAITSLGLVTGNDATYRDPTSYTLYASVDSSYSSLILVSSGSLTPPAGRETAYPDVFFDNSTAYQYYRLVFNSIAGGGGDSYVQVTEISLGINPALTATGSAVANIISGNVKRAANDSISGSDGNDALYGYGGHDTLNGGNDLDSLYGGDGNDSLLGGAGNDYLEGGTGNDILNGELGDDTMSGGAGDDNYTLDSATDVVQESSDQGTDTINYGGTTSYTLADNLEVLNLTGSSAINGVGNDDNNTLYATNNSAANALAGGLGDDTYFINISQGDDATEAINEGTDMLYITANAGATYTLSNTNYMESLVANSNTSFTINGNNLANTLYGSYIGDPNAGTGHTLAGGAGDDVYMIGTNDVVSETAGNGFDTVYIINNANFTISSGNEFEVVAQYGTSTGSITGDTNTNYIFGNLSTGANSLSGGGGNDFYYVGAGDTVNGGTGVDIVYAYTNNYTITNTNVEQLILIEDSSVLVGTGNGSDNKITGNSYNNTLSGGGSGNDTLDGGAGADTMTGGTGTDTLIVDNSSDSVVGGAGTDTVESKITFSLASFADVENLTLTGTTTGTTSDTDAINATGNASANTITGNNGANLLNGGGGADIMNGGAGSDTFIVDNTGDVVSEANTTTDGIDEVQSSVTYTITDVDVENLILTGSSAINATGNASNNLLDGSQNSAINTLTGGAGDDIYIVGTGDIVDEATGGSGNDTIVYKVNPLSIGTVTGTIENRILDDTAGAVSLSGDGNANFLQGNSSNNTLDGLAGNDTLDGGVGVDALIGGDGDDVYFVDDAGDTITETTGTDIVYSDITYTLASGLENLVLLGSANNNGTGNTASNQMTGNAGDNVLADGGGGDDTFNGARGNDTITGGSGNTIYLYNRTDGMDTVTDTGGTDSLQLGADIDLTQVWFIHTGNNLEISLIGTNDKITVVNWYSGSANHIEKITTTSGYYLDHDNVEALVQAMSSIAQQPLGDTDLRSENYDALELTFFTTWQS